MRLSLHIRIDVPVESKQRPRSHTVRLRATPIRTPVSIIGMHGSLSYSTLLGIWLSPVSAPMFESITDG
jgi:hypothetical protein